jgi:hypothetical protein
MILKGHTLSYGRGLVRDIRHAKYLKTDVTCMKTHIKHISHSVSDSQVAMGLVRQLLPLKLWGYREGVRWSKWNLEFGLYLRGCVVIR